MELTPDTPDLDCAQDRSGRTWWALEGAPSRGDVRVPGRLYASFPIYPTERQARDAARWVNNRSPYLPPVRVLRRRFGGEWEIADQPATLPATPSDQTQEP